MTSNSHLWCSHLSVQMWAWQCCLNRSNQWRGKKQTQKTEENHFGVCMILPMYPISCEVCFKIQFGGWVVLINRVPFVLLQCEYQLADLCNYAKHGICFSVLHSWHTVSYLICSSLHFCLRTGSHGFLIF